MTLLGDVRGMIPVRTPPALALAVAGWTLASAVMPAVKWYDARLKRRR